MNTKSSFEKTESDAAAIEKPLGNDALNEVAGGGFMQSFTASTLENITNILDPQGVHVDKAFCQKMVEKVGKAEVAPLVPIISIFPK